LIDALLESVFRNRDIVNQTELLQNFFHQYLLCGTDILVARVGDYLPLSTYSQLLLYIFDRLPLLTEVVVEGGPEFSCNHVIVWAKKEVVRALAKVQSLPHR
jgi:hypothetical protein